MKRDVTCPRCATHDVGLLDGLPDTVGNEIQVRQQFLGVVHGDAEVRLEGKLEALVCTACGYIELYVQEPHRVPFEKLDGFSWVSRTGDEGPYR